MLWLKALHLFFVISWLAGLFYLPRLFVYHAATEDPPGQARFVMMERRLFVMMSIGCIGTVLFGSWLMLRAWWPAPLWLHVKLGLVALLILYHMLCYKLMRDLRAGKRRSTRFYRLLNEVPTLLLLGVLYLVVLKPF